jgi:hypothetical protein
MNIIPKSGANRFAAEGIIGMANAAFGNVVPLADRDPVGLFYLRLLTLSNSGISAAALAPRTSAPTTFASITRFAIAMPYSCGIPIMTFRPSRRAARCRQMNFALQHGMST